MSTRTYVVEVDEALVVEAYDRDGKNLGFALAGVVAGLPPETFRGILEDAGVRIVGSVDMTSAGKR